MKPGYVYMCLPIVTILVHVKSLFCNCVAGIVSLVCSSVADDVTASGDIGLKKGKNNM